MAFRKSVVIRENLDLDMPGALEIFLEVESRVTKRVLRFGRGIAPCGGKLALARDAAHAFASAACHCFQNYREANLPRYFGGLFQCLDRIQRSGHHGCAYALR